MKKQSILFLVLISLSAVLFSQPVSIDTIRMISLNANQIINNKVNQDLRIVEILPISEKKIDLGHIVNFNDNSYVIVSGDYSIPPILGYSQNNQFSFDKAPPGLLYLLERYKAEINYSRVHRLEATSKTSELWNKYLGVPKLQGSLKSAVLPMITTEWSQWSSFNYYCPYDAGEGYKCPAGCTAIALAQILNYWNCKVEAEGSHSYSSDYGTLTVNFGNSTYDWADMGADSWDYENAWLIYSAGVSIDTDYEPDGSTSTPGKAEDALKDYWGFKNSLDLRWRIWHLTTWKNDLKDDLDDGNPLLYSGGSLGGGHSWVIDGYNSSDQFHCNWGWGDDDGYFSLGGFNPGGNNFNEIESAIFYAVPERTAGVGVPDLSPQIVYPGSTNISISAVDGATSYSWTTTNGTITASTTSLSNTLNTSVNSEVCVRAFNTLCDIYSDWDCETFTITSGPITGDDIVCYSTNETYNLSNCPSGATVSWSKSSNLTWIGTPSGTSCTVRASSSSTYGDGWVKATITNTDNNVIYVTKDVWVGKFEGTQVSGQAAVCANSLYTYTANVPGGHASAYSYSWTYPSGWTTSSQWNNNVQLATPQYSMTYGTVRVAVTNACGTSGYSGITVYPGYNCGGSFMASPNPGSDFMEISPALNEAGTLKTIQTDLDITVKVFNSMGRIQFTSKLDRLPYRIDTSTLLDGNYIIQIIDKNNVETIHVLIKH
jgi:hypothetical protein